MNTPGRALLCAVLVAGTACASSAARPAQAPSPPLNPWKLDQELRTPGTVERWGLLRALLVAGGRVRTPLQTERREKSLNRVLERVVNDARQRPSSQPLFLRLHAALHDHMLWGGYARDASDLTDVLDQQRYNCLSGTAAYVLAAQRAGLVASAYGMEGHILAVVFDGAGAHHIETTFRDQSAVTLKTRTEEQAALVPPDLRGTTFDVSAEELVAMVYWNRAMAAVSQPGEARSQEHQEAWLGYVSLGPPRVVAQVMTRAAWAIRGGLQNECAMFGCQLPLALLETWMTPQRLGTLVKPLLRDMRAELYQRWFEAAPQGQKCAVAQQARAADVDHPFIQTLLRNARAAGCGGGR
jgi:hypothetical protein